MKFDVHEETRRRAYDLWEANGRPEGRDEEFWFQALADVSALQAEGKVKKPRKPVQKKTDAKESVAKKPAPKSAVTKKAAPQEEVLAKPARRRASTKMQAA